MRIALICIAIFFFSGKKPLKADLIIFNARIYTVDPSFSITEAMAVKDGRILATGTSREIRSGYSAGKTVDARGRFIYPGFIDAHAHFYRYGLNLRSANLFGTASWEEVLDRLVEFSRQNPGGWITGRGWDQNDWPVKEFPDKRELDSLFPGRPVLLTRVDGHAAVANQVALDLAGIYPGMQLEGGEVETQDGKLTGILVDNAAGLVSAKIPPPTPGQVTGALMRAQADCLAYGLTTVDDCGIDYQEAIFMDSLQKKGQLRMRIYAMLSDAPQNYQWLLSQGLYRTERMHIRSFKVYADGALGSRGACLLEPYSDKPGWHGFLLRSPGHFDSVAAMLSRTDFQMCTHAIGDSGNRVILNIYGKYLKGKNDRRWRIEHAQVVNEADFNLFGRYSIIPSVQPTHATSDMYWAEQRLGPERVKGAYAYSQLMDQNGWIPLGTDFPVEDISPFKTFLAAVFRVDNDNWPAGGYQPENALTRMQALRGMTIWAARSNFEEAEKGSLEKGKLADFVLLDTDLMTATAQQISAAKVLATYLGGEKLYSAESLF